MIKDIVLATLAISTAVSTVGAQARSELSSELLASPCALLSAAEVNQATGRRDYHDGEVLADADEGGEMCMYGIPWEAPAPSDDRPPPVVLSTFSGDEGTGFSDQELGGRRVRAASWRRCPGSWRSRTSRPARRT